MGINVNTAFDLRKILPPGSVAGLSESFYDVNGYVPPGVVAAGLLAHYDFSDGAGTVLTDRSGHANHGTLGGAFASPPTWTAAGLQFGAYTGVDLPPSIWASIRSAHLFCSVGQTPPGVEFSPYIQTLLDSYNGSMAFMVNDDGGTVGFHGAITAGLTQGLTVGGPVSLGFDLVGNKIYSDGVEVPGYLGAAADLPSVASPHVGLGFTKFSGYWYSGTFYYLLLYDRALTAAEFNDNHNYVRGVLAGRGVTPGDTIPASRTRVIFDGDSLTMNAGAGLGLNFVHLIQSALTNPAVTTNLGVNGQTAAQILAAGPTRVDSYWPRWTAAHKVYVLFAGLNDLRASRSPALVLADNRARVAAAKAAGATHAVMATITPFDTPAQFETDRQTLSTGIRNNAAGDGYTVADLAADPVMGPPGAQNDTTYYTSDKIHWTAAGHDKAKAVFMTALAAVGVT